MAGGTVSTLIGTFISALRIWCDGSDGPLGYSCVETINITRAGCFDGVGGEVLLRLEKNNATDRSHESMNGNEKRNYDLFAGGMGASPSSFLLASGGCGSVSFRAYIP